MIIRAYAKINIALKILGKREDGYHELKSFMQALPDLYDVIEIVESDKTEITCSDESLSCGDDNLAAKALALMNKNAKVHIEKHIPIAAGLAGGSADAAAVLYAFEGASEKAYSLASKLGADVPFSLMAIQFGGKCAAIARGTGTKLEPCVRIEGKIVTLTPNLAVSTPEVYGMYDQLTCNSTQLEAATAQLGDTDDLTPQEFALSYGNDLQAPAIKLCPQIQDTLNELQKPHPVYGAAIKVQQSGSGPTCFAIYKEETK